MFPPTTLLLLSIIFAPIINTNSMEYMNDEFAGIEETSREQFPMTCEVRHWNFTAVQTDKNGKQCRKNISTTACYGSCDTFEVGCLSSTDELPIKCA